MSLLRWAAGRDLTATWFNGQAAAMLSASPRLLGAALGVAIDDYRLADFGRFYAARQPVVVPAPLGGEVAAFGRISSLGRLRPYAFPIGGLGPGGFVDAYDARPLWDRGDVGQGETIVFFEVDGYSQKDLSTYAATFGLPAFADPLPHIGPLDLKPEGESEMDLEVAHSIAPGAKLVYVNLDAFGGGGSSPVSQFEQAFSTVSTRYPGAIWSISLGQCEILFGGSDLSTVDQTVAGAERAGSTVFAASGDSGGLECLAANQSDPQIPAEGILFPGRPARCHQRRRYGAGPHQFGRLRHRGGLDRTPAFPGFYRGPISFLCPAFLAARPRGGQLLLGQGRLLGPGRDLLPRGARRGC